MKPSFLPKAGAALVTGGALGGGGVAAYKHTTPRNWQEGLEWEGFSFIESINNEDEKSNAYKAIYLSYKDSGIGDDISDSNADNNWNKIQEWCKSELGKPYKKWGEAANKEREKIIKYCEDTRPVTVEAHLQKLGINKDLWIKNKSNDDDSYKIMFAVYRYYDPFLEEINKVEKEESKHNKDTAVDTGSERLKKYCEEQLSKKTKEVEDFEGLYNRLVWWCQPLEKTTVEERIKQEHPGWEKEEETSSDNGNGKWNQIKGYWQMTEVVFKVVKPGENNGQNLQGSDYQKFCTDNLRKKLHENDVYQKNYLVAKVVCVKQEVQAELFAIDLNQAIAKVAAKKK
ncbi:hypothetical protein [Candidatus Mycoplasma haematohominis]|uniref:hypothetical protein n=1 Tax=Candidatus Mycoplasma haematohominis TaxID=1494318 RepID=UPI001C0A72DA|nr:hypothetical protein [Candidatus Mycoplasma haemohominis]